MFNVQILNPLRKVRGTVFNNIVDLFVRKKYYIFMNINVIELRLWNIFIIFKS